MPSGYNSQQKAAINQFVSFANSDQKTAIKVGFRRDIEGGPEADGFAVPQDHGLGSFCCCQRVGIFYFRSATNWPIVCACLSSCS